MRVDLIKLHLRYVEQLAREYRECLPKHIEDEINELNTKIKDGCEISRSDKQFLITTRETKRALLNQILIWAVKVFNEIDDSVGTPNIEFIRSLAKVG